MAKQFYCPYCTKYKKIELLAKTKPRKQCKTCKDIRSGKA